MYVIRVDERVQQQSLFLKVELLSFKSIIAALVCAQPICTPLAGSIRGG